VKHSPYFYLRYEFWNAECVRAPGIKSSIMMLAPRLLTTPRPHTREVKMKKALVGVSALALVMSLAVACT
jgi:hypothetical protein